jgi:hypothetical protein
MSKIEVDAIDKQSGSTLTLGGSGTAVTLACGATQTGFGRSGSVNWDTTPKTATFTGVNGNGYFVNTTAGVVTANLPASPNAGDIMAIVDYAGTADTNNITVGRNGSNINGAAADQTISKENSGATFVYVDGTQGWKFTETSNVSDIELQPTFIAATGGTITTSGNFKVHTFTGPGTFCVSTVGNPIGSTTVDYLVVAGGGTGGSSGGPGAGAGGGAGGFRLSNSVGCIPAPTMSPLANPTGLPVSVQGYPITVGGGGASSSTNTGNKGVDSVFSTITSTGGGFGGSFASGNRNGGSGGSGGGAGGGSCSPAGTSGTIGSGNTPSVSPSQGNNGGLGTNTNPQTGPYYWNGGGGGGAGAVGASGAQCTASAGGVGSFVSPSMAVSCAGTPGPVPAVRYFAGGGGSGSQAPGQPNSNVGAGGAGGGSPGTLCSPNASSAGTANTGGGSGGNGGNATPNVSGTGGSGIVIIRYKFQ